MRNALPILAALFAVSYLGAADYTIRNDREMPVYKCGEPAGFSVAAQENGAPQKQGKLVAEITLDGRNVLEKRELDFSRNNPAEFTATLKEPGFILVRLRDEKGKEITVPDEQKKGRRKGVHAGAAFEPEKIKLAFSLPDDFRKYWETGRKAIADKPVKLDRVEKFCKPEYTAYYVTVESLGGDKITGYLTIPTGKGPFPAFVTVPGAGPGNSGPVNEFAGKGVITLMMNIHKFPTADNAEEQKARYEADQKTTKEPYGRRNANDRETYFMRSPYLGIDRAVTHIAQMPEWDRKHLVFAGTSQGGRLAIAIGGLNKNITAIAANVPGGCDLGGWNHGRTAGGRSYYYIKGADRTMQYFDCGNFARFVKAPVLTSCGFVDVVCSPASVYAVYNQFPGEKTMIRVPLEGHTMSKAYRKARKKFVYEHLGLENPERK